MIAKKIAVEENPCEKKKKLLSLEIGFFLLLRYSVE
jgi:hypothetical protein